MGFNLFKVVLLTEKEGFAGLSVVWGQSRKGIYNSLCITCSGNPEWGFAAQPQFSDDDNKFLQLLSTANKVEKHLLKNDQVDNKVCQLENMHSSCDDWRQFITL